MLRKTTSHDIVQTRRGALASVESTLPLEYVDRVLPFCVAEEQVLTADEGVAPFLCGFTFGEHELPPGGERSFTLQVDEKTCSDGVFFTMASMLGGPYVNT